MNVLVIGGSGGIGCSIAKKLKNDGHKVLITYTHDNIKADLVCSNVGCDKIHYDLRQSGTANKVRDEHPEIDAVVLAAVGSAGRVTVDELNADELNRQVDLQLFGALDMFLAWKDRKMKYVVVLSEYVIGTPPTGLTPYVVGKYSLMGLCKCMAVELARKNGTTVNMISPGMTDTLLLMGLPSKIKEFTADRNPLGRIGLPDDVADAAVFLLNSDYCNGVNIPVNGGGLML
jgi:NAD(P)-dependent dehydrogenase (short-subunit alcohol dehydrogenase family)